MYKEELIKLINETINSKFESISGQPLQKRKELFELSQELELSNKDIAQCSEIGDLYVFKGINRILYDASGCEIISWYMSDNIVDIIWFEGRPVYQKDNKNNDVQKIYNELIRIYSEIGEREIFALKDTLIQE